MSADTLTMPDTDLEVIPYEDTDDGNEHHTHIISKRDNKNVVELGALSAQDIVDVARMLSMELTALCGYKWIPKRNPEKYPFCQKCMDIHMHSKG